MLIEEEQGYELLRESCPVAITILRSLLDTGIPVQRIECHIRQHFHSMYISSLAIQAAYYIDRKQKEGDKNYA